MLLETKIVVEKDSKIFHCGSTRKKWAMALCGIFAMILFRCYILVSIVHRQGSRSLTTVILSIGPPSRRLVKVGFINQLARTAKILD